MASRMDRAMRGRGEERESAREERDKRERAKSKHVDWRAGSTECGAGEGKPIRWRH